MASDKFSLKWNDYQSNWSQSLSGLRNDTEMADVTLITDDKVKMFAHKILLSSCSEVFNFILKDSKQQNPLLYLREAFIKKNKKKMTFVISGLTPPPDFKKNNKLFSIFF